MRVYNLFFLTLIFTLTYCNKVNNNDKNSKDKNVNEVKIKDMYTPIFDKNDFEYIYQYSGENSSQKIGIRFLNDNKISFHLMTKTLPCDTEYWGEALNINSENDFEIDEENSEAYPVNEFQKESEEEILFIIVAIDKSKVQIKYLRKDNFETDCLPIQEVILTRKK